MRRSLVSLGLALGLGADDLSQVGHGQPLVVGVAAVARSRRRTGLRRAAPGSPAGPRRSARAGWRSGRRTRAVARLVLGDHDLVQLLAGADADDVELALRRRRPGPGPPCACWGSWGRTSRRPPSARGCPARTRAPCSSVIQKRVMRSSVMGSRPVRAHLQEERHDAAAAADHVAVADHAEPGALCCPRSGCRRRTACRSTASWRRRG